jgi:hypothetical protein
MPFPIMNPGAALGHILRDAQVQDTIKPIDDALDAPTSFQINQRITGCPVNISRVDYF